jgi:hypothetical protein
VHTQIDEFSVQLNSDAKWILSVKEIDCLCRLHHAFGAALII